LKNIDDFILIIIILFLFWNLITFFLMGIDKYKSVKGHYRIKEYTLIMTAFLMGGVGTLAGSLFYRHKTKKIKFKVLLPMAVIVNIGVIVMVVKYVL